MASQTIPRATLDGHPPVSVPWTQNEHTFNATIPPPAPDGPAPLDHFARRWNGSQHLQVQHGHGSRQLGENLGLLAQWAEDRIVQPSVAVHASQSTDLTSTAGNPVYQAPRTTSAHVNPSGTHGQQSPYLPSQHPPPQPPYLSPIYYPPPASPPPSNPHPPTRPPPQAASPSYLENAASTSNALPPSGIQSDGNRGRADESSHSGGGRVRAVRGRPAAAFHPYAGRPHPGRLSNGADDVKVYPTSFGYRMVIDVRAYEPRVASEDRPVMG